MSPLFHVPGELGLRHPFSQGLWLFCSRWGKGVRRAGRLLFFLSFPGKAIIPWKRRVTQILHHSSGDRPEIVDGQEVLYPKALKLIPVYIHISNANADICGKPQVFNASGPQALITTPVLMPDSLYSCIACFKSIVFLHLI